MSYKRDFFSTGSIEHDALTAKRLKKSDFIFVGGHASSGFRAVAAMLIDLFIQQSLSKGQEHWYINVLERYELIFSNHNRDMTCDTPRLRMQRLIDNRLNSRMPMKQLITDMGYVLRQLAVDELCANAHVYPHVFLGEKGSILPCMIRQDDTPLGEEGLVALSVKLGLDITVRVSNQDKLLPKLIKYYSSKNGSFPMIQLALDGQGYKPCLTGSLALMSLDTTQCMVSNNQLTAHDPDVADIFVKITDSQFKLAKRFNTICHDLYFLTQRGPKKNRLSKQNLLDIYIKSLANMSPHVSFVGDLKINNKDETNLLWSNHDEYVIKRLVEAISRAICLGYISASLIYNDNNHTTEHPSTDSSMGLFG